MQGEPQDPNRNDLNERLRSLEPLQAQGTLAELAYRRAREALEKALEDASRIRLQALEDAKTTREREMGQLMQSLKALRESAETQVEAILHTANIEAGQARERGRLESDRLLEDARHEAADIAAEAAALRQAAEARSREVDQLEASFNQLIARLNERLGLSEKPPEGFFRKLFH